MNQVTEQVARALTLDEIATRLADEANDDGVRYFARRFLNEGIKRESDEIEELEGELDDARHEASRYESDLEEKTLEYDDLCAGIRKSIAATTDHEALVKALEELL